MRAAWVGLLVVLGGCLGGAEPPQPQDAPVQGATTAQARSAAGNLTNLTTLGLGTQWVRDTWGDAQELVLIDTTVQVENVLTTAVINCPVNCFDGFMLPEEGKLVPPGAGSVEVTATWTPPPAAPTMVMNLFWRTAADGGFGQDVLQSGTPFVIPVTPDDVDAPLQRWSAWWFDVFPTSGGLDAMPAFDVQVRVVVQRAPGELPAIPEPPDPWAGGATIPLLRAATRQNTGWRVPDLTNGCTDCEGFVWEGEGPGLVAPGAGKVTATLSWDWPGPTKGALWYVTAGARDAVPMTLVEDGAMARTYEAPVSEADWDSPYQRRTSWVFFLRYDTQGENAGVIAGTASLDAAAVHA